jgi:hypothetical protein
MTRFSSVFSVRSSVRRPITSRRDQPGGEYTPGCLTIDLTARRTDAVLRRMACIRKIRFTRGLPERAPKWS